MLGQGRIGNVYQAIDLEDFSLVAIKIIHLHLMQEKGMRRRFLQEVNAIPRLEHPSIVKVHEAGIDTEQNILYLTMDYLPGRSLNAYLRQLQFNNQQLDLGDALIIVAQIAEALGYAHQKGLIHRDIRPTVILFRLDDKPEESRNLPGRATIGDFALESILQAEKEPFTPSLPYMSPEAFLERPLDGRSDIYSLGVLLYQLTTDHLPFTAATLADAARQHPYEDPPSPRTYRPDMPLVVESAILKAMAKKPEARFQSGAEMAAILRGLAETMPDRIAGTAVAADFADIKTVVVPPLIAISSQWSEEEDHVMITRDVPHNLNRQIITIGRSETNDIILADSGVTRQHAQLERTETGWNVRDLGSQNGTYLDENPLLPDIPEEWEPHQTLRVGPFYLHLQPGKGYNFQERPFLAAITPTEIAVLPGERADIAITLMNRGTAVDEFSLTMDRIPPEWISLPSAPIRLRPDERTTITAAFHPPLVQNILVGASRYLLTVRSAARPEEPLAIPGIVRVLPPENMFSASLSPTRLSRAGQSFLTVHNRSLNELLFTLTSQDETGDMRFSIWRPREARPANPTAGKNGSGKRAAAPKLGAANKLPIVRRIAAAPRRLLMQVEAGPRQSLNRAMPGLGAMLPRLNLAQQAGKVGDPRRPGAQSSPAAPAVDAVSYEEVVFPGNLYTQITVPGGQEEMVRVGLDARKRPLFGRTNRLYPYTLRVTAPGCEPQTLGGQIELRPRLRMNPALLLIPFILLFLCLGSLIAISVWQSSTLAAILSTPADIDNDGLSNLAEVYVYKTDPNRADTDGDGLDDGLEIELKTNPLKADTDDDGLSDAEELRLNTNPRFADTDGDNLSDGLEVLRLNTNPLVPDTLTTTVTSLVGLATPSPVPSATPTTVPTPAPTAVPSSYTLTVSSQSSEDGYILQDPALGRAPAADNTFLLVGEGDSRSRQIKAFLSFDTSELPDDATILSARIQLRRGDVTGKPETLGEIHFDIAPANGFARNWALESEDFDAFAAETNIAALRDFYSAEVLEAVLSEAGSQAINRNGRSQFRLHFTLPNNGDAVEDRLSFFAANATDNSLHPRLIIDYELP
ncbi:MAG: protein kinase [Chloroflexota bacterium]